MKMKIILLVISSVIFASSLKTRSLETMRLATKRTDEGDFDIIKILNINDTDIDNQETRILRRKSKSALTKVKKSDLESFEGYLDAYLSILRKFNKKIAKNNTKNSTNLTFEVKHKNDVSEEKKSSPKNGSVETKNATKLQLNDSHAQSVLLNSTRKENSNITVNNGNNTAAANVKDTQKIKTKNKAKTAKEFAHVQANLSNLSNVTSSALEGRNSKENQILPKLAANNSVVENMNKSDTDEIQLKDSISLSPANIYVDINLKESNKNLTKVKFQNKTIRLPKNKITRQLKEIVTQKKKESEQHQTKTAAEELKQPEEKPKHPEDKVYEKIKNSNVINEEFIQKQKELINSGKNMFLNENNDFNIYKKIINISLSLIVVGLLMGILLGLILVMYLNSRSSK